MRIWQDLGSLLGELSVIYEIDCIQFNLAIKRTIIYDHLNYMIWSISCGMWHEMSINMDYEMFGPFNLCESYYMILMSIPCHIWYIILTISSELHPMTWSYDMVHIDFLMAFWITFFSSFFINIWNHILPIVCCRSYAGDRILAIVCWRSCD